MSHGEPPLYEWEDPYASWSWFRCEVYRSGVWVTSDWKTSALQWCGFIGWCIVLPSFIIWLGVFCGLTVPDMVRLAKPEEALAAFYSSAHCTWHTTVIAQPPTCAMTCATSAPFVACLQGVDTSCTYALAQAKSTTPHCCRDDTDAMAASDCLAQTCQQCPIYFTAWIQYQCQCPQPPNAGGLCTVCVPNVKYQPPCQPCLQQQQAVRYATCNCTCAANRQNQRCTVACSTKHTLRGILSTSTGTIDVYTDFTHSGSHLPTNVSSLPPIVVATKDCGTNDVAQCTIQQLQQGWSPQKVVVSGQKQAANWTAPCWWRGKVPSNPAAIHWFAQAPLTSTTDGYNQDGLRTSIAFGVLVLISGLVTLFLYCLHAHIPPGDTNRWSPSAHLVGLRKMVKPTGNLRLDSLVLQYIETPPPASP